MLSIQKNINQNISNVILCSNGMICRFMVSDPGMDDQFAQLIILRLNVMKDKVDLLKSKYANTKYTSRSVTLFRRIT